MTEPRDLVKQIESQPRLPAGDEERVNGWGVFGLPFAAGHILALRRFPASSVGPGFTTIWYRDPTERWTFFTDIEPEYSCPRYFGSAIAETVVTPLTITWMGPREFVITSGNDEVRWAVSIKPTPATRTLNSIGSLIPDPLWKQVPVLAMMGGVAGYALHAGHIGLHGKVPNGQTFAANPRLVWSIPSSTAIVRSVDLGPLGPLSTQARLADFWLPQVGIFMIGMAFLESFDPAQHQTVTSLSDHSHQEGVS